MLHLSDTDCQVTDFRRQDLVRAADCRRLVRSAPSEPSRRRVAGAVRTVLAGLAAAPRAWWRVPRAAVFGERLPPA